jgi:glycosyltransferase involved in cell wall biosynthesis
MAPSDWAHKFEALNACVLIPTYNNAGTLKEVLDSVLQYTSRIVVVNDGSTDSTAEILSHYGQISVVSYEQNVGKGYALRRGFTHCTELGYDHAITIDSDGQHYAQDLPVFLEKLEKEGPALIMGARNMDQESVPGKSSWGNRFSSFWYWVETGIRLPDTQSGYRSYPLCLMKGMRFFTIKYELEIEVIVRAAWEGIRVVHAPVSVYYPPKHIRISHFRPFRDFCRITLLNTIFVLMSFFYIRPRNIILSLFRKETYRSLLDQVLHSEHSDAVKAFSVGFGVFMGIIPIWGFQLVTAIFLAILFRLNKALVIISANISIPPMIPVIIFLSYKMGGLWMGENSTRLSFSRDITLDQVRLNFVQYVYGSITLAVFAAIAAGMATWVVLALLKLRKKQPLG